MADRLARFQAALLELLAEEATAEEMLERLRTDPAFADYRDYVARFEPRMIVVAAHLTKKWGVPREPREQEHPRSQTSSTARRSKRGSAVTREGAPRARPRR